jgi:hypothetical protein
VCWFFRRVLNTTAKARGFATTTRRHPQVVIAV